MTATTAIETRPRGKRGPQRYPYTTKVARIPTPILESVMAQAREYRAKALAEYRAQQREARS